MTQVIWDGQLTKGIRWIARVLGSLAAAFWTVYFVSFVVSTGLPDQRHVVILTLGAVVGVITAWWREGVGGALLLFCALANGTIEYMAIGYRMPWLVFILSGPFLIAGLLFWAAWYRSRPQTDSDKSDL